MLRAALVAVAAVALVACSGSSSEPLDAGFDAGPGTQDAGRSCSVLDAGCSAQTDCGSRDGLEAYACVAGQCTLEAQFGTRCSYAQVIGSVQVTLSPAWGTPPHSLEVRAFYPFRTDGSALGCTDVLNQADFPDGGYPLDADPSVNLQNLGAYGASCTSGGSCQYLLNLNLVTGIAPVILVQGYTGGPQPDALHASGLRLGEGCVGGQTASHDGDTFAVTIAP